jgi:hypothetical protein
LKHKEWDGIPTKTTGLNAEITAAAVISAIENEMDLQVFKLRFGFHEGADALGTQHLANHPPIFHDADRLEIRAKSSLSGLF